MNTQERLDLAYATIRRLGKYRAVEYGSVQNGPIPNPLGPGYTGVDLDGTTYRARIGVCNALSGVQKRLTLGRSYDPDCAALMYRMAHVALYGSYSWAADSLSPCERDLVARTRRATLEE